MKPMAIYIKQVGKMSMHERVMEAEQRVVYCQDNLTFLDSDLSSILNKTRAVDCRPVFKFEKRSVDKVNENIKI